MTNYYLDSINTDISDFKGRRCHFIGIGGVSMRVLARLAMDFFESVSGSDAIYSETIDELNALGIYAYVGSREDVVRASDVVVYSAAIPSDDIELRLARCDEGIVCLERAEFLAIVERAFGRSVAIAGTHGKSTTTAIIGHVIERAGLDAFVHVGATPIDEMPTRGRDCFVTEACEYNRSLLALSPHIGVVLNVDYDHPDIYTNIEDVEVTFDEFMDRCDKVVAHESVKRLDVTTFGTSDMADYRIVNINRAGAGYQCDLVHDGKAVHITSPLLGAHNINNVVASYIVCHMLGIEDSTIIEGISTFSGLKRRYERIGETQSGAVIIHDYAHHPEEIERAIATAHGLTHGHVMVVFEPHTYSRTRSLIERFVRSFYWADTLILLPTYSARETPDAGYTTLELIEHMRAVDEYPLYFATYNRAREYIWKNSAKGDIVLVLGAGSVYHLADMLAKKIPTQTNR